MKKSVKLETPLKNAKETLKEPKSNLERDKAAKNLAPMVKESRNKHKSRFLCHLPLSNCPIVFLKVKEPHLKKYSLSNQGILASVL